MALKVVLFFNGVEDGWTETYYATSSNPYTFIKALPNSFYQARAKGLDKDSYLVAIRATSVDPPRNNFTLFFGNAYPGQGSILSTVANPSIENVDALVQFIDNNGVRKKSYLRGMPVSWAILDGNGFPNPPADFYKWLTIWTNALSSNGLCVRVAFRPPAGAPALQWFNVISAAPSPVNPVQTNLLIDKNFFALVDGVTPVVCQGVPRNDLPGFPKVFVPDSASNAAPFVVAAPYRFRAANNPQATQKMRFCLLKYAYTPIASSDFERFTTHKTGRPFFEPRGRAPVAVKRT